MTSKSKKKKIHPWRLCPAGEHWVRTHLLHVPPSKSYPEGHITTRHAHCAHNPSGKDQLYPEEINEIADLHFSKLKDKPCPIALDFLNGARFDDFISGWVEYWNDIFDPKDVLKPNFVKALIASESGFNPTMLANKKNSNSARGLMQITNDTRKILGDENGELKDHFLTVTKADLNDPNVNISAGVRWLFQKKLLATSKLKRTATWEEAVAEYKGTLKDWQAGTKSGKKIMRIFNEHLDIYNQCKK